MKLGIVFSNDWELFGDGSGDYFEIQHEPLRDLLDVMDGHGARLTVMAEVGQQWAHQRLAADARAQEIAAAWEDALVATVRRGMDVQLHIHPQWLDATFDGKAWRLDLNKWALSSLGPADAAAALRRGKRYLDSLLQPVLPRYECIAFRAGAYCIEPSGRTVPALVEAGLKCDTSVIKGTVNPGLYDYTHAHSNIRPWVCGTGDVKHPGAVRDGVLEIPVYSVSMLNSPVLAKLFGIHLGSRVSAEERRWFRENRAVSERRYPLRSRPFRRHHLTASGLPRLIIRTSAIELDYDLLPASTFVGMVAKAFTSPDLKDLQHDDVIVPVMAIGHVKQMHNTDNINRILDGLDRRFGDRIVHWTLREATEYWLERLKPARVAEPV